MFAPQTIALDWTEAPHVDREPHAGSAIPSLCQTFAQRVLRNDSEYHCYSQATATRDGLADFLFTTPESEHAADQIFNKLRWGGMCLFASPQWRQVAQLSEDYQKQGFVIEHGPTSVYNGWCRLPIPLISKRVH